MAVPYALSDARFTHRSAHRVYDICQKTLAIGVVFALMACADLVSADAKHKNLTSTPTPTTDPTPAPTPIPVSGNPILGAAFWVDPTSNAQATANEWRVTRPDDAVQMDKIAEHSQAMWLKGGDADVRATVANAVAAVAGTGATPVFVAYNIPQRDCGGLSAGGTTPAEYKSWISSVANGLGTSHSVVILEPDALSQLSCLSSADQTTRIDLIYYAITVLKAKGATVYLDGGHSAWKSASTQAALLTRAGITGADGFFLNVSNFQYTANSINYGRAISTLVGGKHFVIDTSRNGQGPTADAQWCNPAGRGLGFAATTMTADPLLDAYLWIKPPGESDGACNGDPVAGVWMPEYALGLAQRGVI
ncbi:MAG: glycoside hydrolase family 6 protein [Gemmatimonadaceae bacterium]